MSRRKAVFAALTVAAAALLSLAPEVLAAGGNNVARNIGGELRARPAPSPRPPTR